MTDWLHCNRCFKQPDGSKFALTDCGHIFCYGCLNKGN